MSSMKIGKAAGAESFPMMNDLTGITLIWRNLPICPSSLPTAGGLNLYAFSLDSNLRFPRSSPDPSEWGLSDFWDLNSIPFDAVPTVPSFSQNFGDGESRNEKDSLAYMDDIPLISSLSSVPPDLFPTSPFERIGGVGGILGQTEDIWEDNLTFAFDERVEEEATGHVQGIYFDQNVVLDEYFFEEGRQEECELLLKAFILSYLDLGYPNKVRCPPLHPPSSSCSSSNWSF